ncbi:hypothetical protein, partial [Nitratidesulfovibrio oxamicus]
MDTSWSGAGMSGRDGSGPEGSGRGCPGWAMAADGVMLPVTGRTGSPARSANPANPVSPARAHATVNGTMCRRKACAAAR